MERKLVSDISKTGAQGLVCGEKTATTSKSYKWILVAMLSCAFFFHQADRALFGLLTIPIQKDLGLTDVQIGWINSVLSWTLAGMAFIAGPVFKHNPPTSLSVVVGKSGIAHRREDGVYVLPITSLRP